LITTRGAVKLGTGAGAGHAGDDHPGGPAAAARSPARARGARGGAGRRPQVHRRRGGAVPQRRDGAAPRPGLAARTEGWAAGLQLAALSARTHAGSGDVAGFVEAFSGSHRFVLDYLVEEVLDRQPDATRAFLLDTSVLDQLAGGLCDALTGRSDGRPMLETLERENLFVVALDDERRWYRYHHLFAEALRARLAARDPDRVAALHAAAGRWLAEQGLLEDAVRHALASGDHERTADLVELALADLRRRRQDRTLRDWLAALPGDVVRRRPLLAMFAGWSRLSEGDVDGVEAWLDAAAAGTPSTIRTAASPAVADRERELRSLPAMVAVYCFLGNDASWRLMERVGMRRETHAVRESRHRSGQWLDTVGYAMLAEEWSPAGWGTMRM
jgi:ATP/maltotriose-dependent transcriptional regulator MalT